MNLTAAHSAAHSGSLARAGVTSVQLGKWIWKSPIDSPSSPTTAGRRELSHFAVARNLSPSIPWRSAASLMICSILFTGIGAERGADSVDCGACSGSTEMLAAFTKTRSQSIATTAATTNQRGFTGLITQRAGSHPRPCNGSSSAIHCA